ncbi:MAG: PilW family protein [Pseudomonadota bacterium]
MRKTESGLSLIEMMVSITVAMILSIVVLLLYSGQMRTFAQVASKENTEQEIQSAANVVGQLLRQAIICQSTLCTSATSIGVTYNGGGRNGNVLRTPNKSVQVDFTLPGGYYAWPNTTAPFTNNFIRLTWAEASGQLNISAAASAAGHSAATTRTLLGNSNLVVTNFDLWPMTAGGAAAANTTCTSATTTGCPYGGYDLAITARSAKRDHTYTNPLDTNDGLGLKHFRTVTVNSNIYPRN